MKCGGFEARRETRSGSADLRCGGFGGVGGPCATARDPLAERRAGGLQPAGCHGLAGGVLSTAAAGRGACGRACGLRSPRTGRRRGRCRGRRTSRGNSTGPSPSRPAASCSGSLRPSEEHVVRRLVERAPLADHDADPLGLGLFQGSMHVFQSHARSCTGCRERAVRRAGRVAEGLRLPAPILLQRERGLLAVRRAASSPIWPICSQSPSATRTRTCRVPAGMVAV